MYFPFEKLSVSATYVKYVNFSRLLSKRILTVDSTVSKIFCRIHGNV